MTRRVLHLDLDAFFASVEQRDNPRLKGIPVVVGGDPDRRGVVCAASYEARAFGVRSAMPCREAYRRCPQAIFLPPDFSRYQEASRQVMAIFREVTPLVEPLSLDEAFLDCTQNHLGEPSGTRVATWLRQQILRRVGLTASAGVAPNKLVAKIASDLHKPDGLTVVPPAAVPSFLAPLPVERLWGVGPVTARRFHQAGLRTLGEVARLDEAAALRRLGPHGPAWRRWAQGEDDRPIVAHRERKQRGSERTLEHDLLDLPAVAAVATAAAQRVAAELAQSDTLARGLTLKVRYSDFSTVTRSVRLPRPERDPARLVAVALELLQRTEAGRRPVRLVGVSASGLGEEGKAGQLALPFGGARAA